MPLTLSLAAFIIALASAAVAYLRHRALCERLEAAIGAVDQRLAAAVSESAAQIDALVQSHIAAQSKQQHETAEALSNWSAELVAEVNSILEALRATVTADTTALVSRALAEHQVQQNRRNE